MSTFLRQLFGLQRGATANYGCPRTFQPGFEALEDRVTPASVTILPGLLMYNAGSNVVNNLSVRWDNGSYVFTDTAESISVFTVGGVPLSGVTGNGTGSVRISPVVVITGPQPVLTWSNIQLNLGDRTDRLTVQSTVFPIQASLGAGSDVVHLGNAANSLDGIQAPVFVNGDTHDTSVGDRLTLHDEGTTTARQYQAAPGVFTRGNIPILTNGLEHITLEATPGDDTLAIAGAQSGSLVTLRGNGGNDYFYFADVNAVRNTVGALAISGGTGINWLDYSRIATDVRVNLDTHSVDSVPALSATGVAAGISDIRHVRGGGGNDRLIGNAANNILLGGAGHDRLFGRHGRDILIGGSGEDDLDGGDGDDILIGGLTVYDLDRTAMLAIMAEWERPISRTDRIRHLQNPRTGGFNEGHFLRANDDIIADVANDDYFGGEFVIRDNRD